MAVRPNTPKDKVRELQRKLYVCARRGPPEPGEAAVHPEGRREAAATWDTDGTGPRGTDGGKTRHRADLRGGFSAGKLRLPSEEERDAGTGSPPRGGQPGP